MGFRNASWAFALGFAVLALASHAAAAERSCPKDPLPHMEGVWALAVTWQPAFCETRNPNRLPPECKEGSKLTRFTLHGLWPQWREYCVEALSAEAVSQNPRLESEPCAFASPRQWSKLPEVRLPADLAADLRRVMPGVESKLDRHEHFKHGTCSGLAQADYFRKAITLVDALNESKIGAFLDDHHGKEFSVRAFCTAVEASLGAEAVAAVEADAPFYTGPDGVPRRYFTELRIWLKPVDGHLTLTSANFVPVPPGAGTLGPEPANPLCNDLFYLDRPGMKR